MTVVCPAGCSEPLPEAFRFAEDVVLRCAGCGLYTLRTAPSATAREHYDRSQFDAALRTLRASNYALVLRHLEKLKRVSGTRLLDVGCSSGWFLEAAARAGGKASGIEPDEFFYRRLTAQLPREVEVVHGFFPADLPGSWNGFDWITFHDVFEHLPDPPAVLKAVQERLAPDGYLVLSLPSADGFVFQTGRLLYRLGRSAALERMFQVHYPFPHLFYFAPRSITALAKRAGFTVVSIDRLRSFSTVGALQRARMDQATSLLGHVRNYINAAALVVLAGVERFLKPDSILVVLRAARPCTAEPRLE